MMPVINTTLPLRRFQLIGFASLVAMLGVVGSWSVLTELNGAVIAPATIMVESYSKKVQHKEGGIVGEIRVKDGDRVEVGQPLVILDNTETKSELAIIDGLLDEALTKRARLEAQRDKATEIVYPPEIAAAGKRARPCRHHGRPEQALRRKAQCHQRQKRAAYPAD